MGDLLQAPRWRSKPALSKAAQEPSSWFASSMKADAHCRWKSGGWGDVPDPRVGSLQYYQEQDYLNTTAKVGNLEALVNALSAYESSFDGLIAFLEQLTLDRTTLGTDDPRDREGVTLITMHNTKGLEFDRVFVTGLEEGLFPGRLNEGDEDIQEERRIFYVAVTRAGMNSISL